MVRLEFNFCEGNDFASFFDRYEFRLKDAYDKVLDFSGEGSEFLGWQTLPSHVDEGELAEIERRADAVRGKADVLVVIGIGGSYLGARAVIEALNPNFPLKSYSSNPQIIYAGENLSEEYMADLTDYLADRDYCLCVISKSGTTTEPAIAFRILRRELEKKYGPEEARERIIAITDTSKGALRRLVRENSYASFVIRDDIGGRYSVLTPVGLFPIAVAGYDIRKLLSGARAMREALVSCGDFSNIAWQYAAFRNCQYDEGKKMEAFVVYQPSLQYFSRWWQQLFGETEGKAFKGLCPVSLLNTTDLHSMGQYIQQGERIMFETVLSVERSKRRVSIPEMKDDADGLNYLCDKSMQQINLIAESATREAHLEGGVPQMRVVVDKIDEYELGALIYFFEFSCALSAYVLGVNPFDQPGVENYKRNMFAMLGRK